jgi:hypothetical protein
VLFLHWRRLLLVLLYLRFLGFISFRLRRLLVFKLQLLVDLRTFLFLPCARLLLLLLVLLIRLRIRCGW